MCGQSPQYYIKYVPCHFCIVEIVLASLSKCTIDVYNKDFGSSTYNFLNNYDIGKNIKEKA